MAFEASLGGREGADAKLRSQGRGRLSLARLMFGDGFGLGETRERAAATDPSYPGCMALGECESYVDVLGE